MMLKAPWTCTQVVALNRWQTRGDVHPFTCGTEGCGHTLFADHDGWHCPACDYTQDWAHPFMAAEPVRSEGAASPAEGDRLRATICTCLVVTGGALAVSATCPIHGQSVRAPGPVGASGEPALQRLLTYFREQAACFDEEARGEQAASIKWEKQRVRDAYRDCADRLAAAASVPSPPAIVLPTAAEVEAEGFEAVPVSDAPAVPSSVTILDPGSDAGQRIIRNSAFEHPLTHGDPPPSPAAQEPVEHSVLAHKYNDRSECPACSRAIQIPPFAERQRLIDRACESDDGFISAGNPAALSSPPVADSPTEESLPQEPQTKPCASGHVWSNQYGDDWTPDEGTPCDCRQRVWGGKYQPSKPNPTLAGARMSAEEKES